jgi:threonine aldolase
VKSITNAQRKVYMIKKYRIDLFSDTNTNPSSAMRAFMCHAEVGNEVAGEDPTVNRLLDRVCELLGKEIAIFLPSGTMCNGIAYRVLCKRPGDLIILDKTAHALNKEAGIIPGLAHATAYAVEGERGIFTASHIEPILTQTAGYNVCCPRVVSVEQTTNFGGGAIWPFQTLKDVCDLAHNHQLSTHLDGARLFNAVAETGIAASEYCSLSDSVWVDFSKSLGAPMGAVLAGSKAFIDEAWYYKFQQGGGMHQVGMMAAGCIYALDNNMNKLKTLHVYTRKLSDLLSTLSFIKIDTENVETNILLFNIVHPFLNAYDFEFLLKEKGIRVFALNQTTLRAILHLDITEANMSDVFHTLKKIGKDVT